MNPSEEIFHQRFLPLYPRLYAVALSITGNSTDAADAVQDSMTKIWSRISDIADLKSPLGYAMTILHNSAIDIVRSHKSTELTDNISTEPTEPDTVEFLYRAIRSLPDFQRRAVELSAFAELSAEEIASQLHTSPANARQLLSRGRRKLREIFQKTL